MDESDVEVVVAICSGKEEQLRQVLAKVIEEHGTGLIAAIEKFLVARGFTEKLDVMAEDILNTVIEELLQRGRSEELLDISSSLRQYLYGAAKRRAIQYFRDGKKNHENIPLDGILPEAPFSDTAAYNDLLEAFHDCLERLTGLEKEYISIAAQEYPDCPSPEEIAKYKNVSSVSVRNRLCMARKKMKDCLVKKGFAGENNE